MSSLTEVGDLQILVRPVAGITEDAVGSRHAAGGTSLTPRLDYIQGVGASAVGVGHISVLAVGPAQSPVVGGENSHSLSRPAAHAQSFPLACSGHNRCSHYKEQKY